MILTKEPVFQEFHIEGVQHITPANALKALHNEEAIMIDVREEPECSLESITSPGVLYYPMSGIVAQLSNIPREKPIIIMCNAGVRSTRVVNFFNHNGFINAVNLDGGIIAWKGLGLPTQHGL
jgi:rhodanese-related sulfurtransferase